MYDGFQRDLRRAVEGGDEAVRQFIHDTAQRTGADPFEVFAETAKQRILWDRGLDGESEWPARRPQRRGSRRRRPSVRKVARQAAGRLLGGLWQRRGRRRGGLVRQASRAALGAARRHLGRASKRLARASWRVARRELRRSARQIGRLARKQLGEAGVLAYSLGYWLKNRKWPTKAQLRPKAPQQPQRRPIPQPSPAVAAMLDDGYTEREAVYLFGARDDLIRDPHDDWPGALADFRTALRRYVGELRRYIAEEVS